MNNRLYHQKNAKLNTQQVSANELHDHAINQAALGNLALHVESGFGNILYKLDDPAILGNLREDGGTELAEGERQSEIFQLYLTVSCTLLPPSKYPVAQNLYSYLGDIFAGFDITRGVIRNFSAGDGQSHYQYKNKNARPSYKMTFFSEYLPSKSPQERYDYVSNRNHDSANSCTIKGDGPFDRHEPSFKRGMNELLLKINIASMVCMGATATESLLHPEIILKLILIQQNFKMNFGITFPIVIYNNQNYNQQIDFLDSEEITIEANIMIILDVSKTLANMSARFPNGLELNFGKNRYSIADVSSMYAETESSDYQSTLFNECTSQVHQGLQALTAKLPSYSDADGIIHIHKGSKPHALESEKYLEINQPRLKKFIDEKILLNNGTPANDETSNLLAKAYNLQFRLFIYDKLLANKSVVNYGNIKDDLKWLAVIMRKLNRLDLTSSMNLENDPRAPSPK